MTGRKTIDHKFHAAELSDAEKKRINLDRTLRFYEGLARQEEMADRNYLRVVVSVPQGFDPSSATPSRAQQLLEEGARLWKERQHLRAVYPEAGEGIAVFRTLEQRKRVLYGTK